MGCISTYMVQRLINSSVHIALGVSPHQVIFGNSIDLQRGMIPTLNQELENRTSQPMLLRSWVDSLLFKQQRLIKVAQDTQRRYAEGLISKRLEGIKYRKPTLFPVNSYVLVRYPQSLQGRGPPTKFHSFWRGPYKVESVQGDRYIL